MSPEALVVIAAHLPLVGWLIIDRFQTANFYADYLETFFPCWFQWGHSGDPVSWIHHALVALVVSLWGGVWAVLLTPDGFLFGAAFGGWCAFGGFVVRETWGALDNLMKPNAWTHPSPHRVGWAVDGIMDCIGPLLVALTWTLL